MKLINNLKKLTNDLKCYDGLNGYKQTNTGFAVAFKVAGDILDMSARGHRARNITVNVSNDRIESIRDHIIAGEDERNIVGLSSITKYVSEFRRQNNLKSVSMEISLLEIKGCKKMYIQLINFIIIK